MLEELFRFPIVMVDIDSEEKKVEKKKSMGLSLDEDEEDYDIIYGEAEYPYWDLIGLEDRWLPSKESLDKALEGRFEACMVRFANVGQLLVPWTKKKFKAEILKFGDEYLKSRPRREPEARQLKVLTLSQDQFEKITKEDGTANEGE